MKNGLGKDLQAPALDRQSLNELFSMAYEELRRLAWRVKRNDQNSTLNPTALVNEAWLKLAGSSSVRAMSMLHFKRIAARAMRQVLVEAARRRGAGKRGNAIILDPLSDTLESAGSNLTDILMLDEALSELERLDPRQAAFVEIRFFSGLEIAEAAAELGISEATAIRTWRAARAWLGARLRPAVNSKATTEVVHECSAIPPDAGLVSRSRGFGASRTTAVP